GRPRESHPAALHATRSPHPPQLLADDLLQPRRLLELSKQLARQALDLLLDRLSVVFLGRRADITTRGQRVVGVLDLGERSRVAEAWFVLIRESRRFRGSVPAPGVEGAGDLGDVLLAECPFGAVDHVAQLARIDKQNL